MMDNRLIERELLLSALDEDAVLSAAENIMAKATGVDAHEVLAVACRLAEDGYLEFYKYDEDQAVMAITPEKVRDEIRAEPYGVFLQQTDATGRQLTVLQKI